MSIYFFLHLAAFRDFFVFLIPFRYSHLCNGGCFHHIVSVVKRYDIEKMYISPTYIFFLFFSLTLHAEIRKPLLPKEICSLILSEARPSGI